MTQKKLILLAVMCVALAACGSQSATNVAPGNANTAKPAIDRAAEEKALREADLAWSAVGSKLDVEGVAGFMTEDGVGLPPNAPAARGREAVKNSWKELLGLKNLTISWEPTTVQVAESGEIGFTNGTWKMAWDDKAGRVEDHGKYLEVWKKVGGKWLCAYDMYSSDQAAPAQVK